MGYKKVKIAIFLCFIIGKGIATEEVPWIDRVLVPIISLESGYQHFNHLNTGHHFCRYPGRDYFLNGSFLFAREPEYCFEIEARATRTHQHGLALDQLKQTARYAFLDDARGDPNALTVGIELIEPISFGLKDPSFIHHSLFETELHIAIGKEWAYEDFYFWRFYAFATIGYGFERSPWVRGFVAIDYQYLPDQFLKGRLIGQGGFGAKNLHINNFKGYGSIAYRIVDVELEYIRLSENFEFSVKYLKSLFRRNCQANLQQFSLTISLPFNF